MAYEDRRTAEEMSEAALLRVEDSPATTATATASRPPAIAPQAGDTADLATVLDALDRRGIGISRERARTLRDGAECDVLQLTDCPFHPNETHMDAAAIYAFTDGSVGFVCQGGRCKLANHRLRDLLELLGLDRVAVRSPKSRTGLAWRVAAQIAPQQIESLWDGRVIVNELNLLYGNEDAGKGLLLSRLMADLTTGTGEIASEPSSVGYISKEEDAQRVIVPRLTAAGADLNRVLIGPSNISFPAGTEQFFSELAGHGCRFVFMDVLNSWIEQSSDTTAAQATNFVLNEIAEFARKHHVTVIGSMHLNRSSGATTRGRAAHSIEFLRVCRSAIVIGQPNDTEDDCRALIHDKHNYTAKAAGKYLWVQTRAVEVERADGQGRMYQEVPYIEIDGPCDYNVAQLCPAEIDPVKHLKRVEEAMSKVDELQARILEYWRVQRYPDAITHKELRRLLDGYSANTKVVARRKLGVKAVRERENGKITGSRWDFTANFDELKSRAVDEAETELDHF